MDELGLPYLLIATPALRDPNFVQTVEALKLSRDDVITLVRNSFEASFIDAATRAKHLARLEALVR